MFQIINRNYIKKFLVAVKLFNKLEVEGEHIYLYLYTYVSPKLTTSIVGLFYVRLLVFLKLRASFRKVIQ